MGKIKHFTIIYDKPNFAAGGIVTGKVVLDVAKAVKIRKITMMIEGKCKVKWPYGEDTLKSKERYFGNYMDVYDPGEEQVIDVGEHMFEFSFPLSPNIPCSFQGEYGYVNYYCEATLKKSGFTDFERSTTAQFAVVRHLDLNREPEGIKYAMEGRETSEVNCCCCISGDIYAEFRINKQGFVPGEYLFVNALVKNRSNTEVSSTRVSLEQHVTFFAFVGGGLFSSREPKPKYTKNYICTIRHDSIKSGETDTWEAVPIEIPNLPFSRLTGCSFIDVCYTITFKVYVNHGDPVKMGCAITIGSIPFREEGLVAQPIALNAITTQPIAPQVHPVSNRNTPSPPPPYADDIDPEAWKLPPPSYDECIAGMTRVTTYST